MSRFTKAGRWLLGAGAVVLFVVLMMSTYSGGGSRYPRGLASRPDIFNPSGSAALPQAGADSIDVGVRRQRTANEDLFIADLDVTNRLARPVSAIRIDCEGTGESGPVIGHTAATLAVVVPAHGSMTVRTDTLGFLQAHVAAARCRAIGFSPV